MTEGKEIKQIREEMAQYEKDFDNLCSMIDQTEAKRLSAEYKTTDQNGRSRYVNNMVQKDRPRLTNARKKLSD